MVCTTTSGPTQTTCCSPGERTNLACNMQKKNVQVSATRHGRSRDTDEALRLRRPLHMHARLCGTVALQRDTCKPCIHARLAGVQATRPCKSKPFACLTLEPTLSFR